MGYASWSVVFGEQPSAAKWNILGTNDASFNDGSGFPTGVSIQGVGNTTSAVATGTTIIPFDDTIPQNTEGDQYMTQAITPKNSANTLVIEAVMFGSFSSGPHELIAALFQDTTANALAVANVTVPANAYRSMLFIKYTMLAGTTSSTTFKIRIGGESAGTYTFNGSGGSRVFGTAGKSSITVQEIKA